MKHARLILIVLCLWAPLAQAQDLYPLQLLWPTAVGAPGTGHDADSRLYRARQGIEYNVPAVANGGTWTEYVFSLNNEPEGMSIVAGPWTTQPCTAGTITWTNPQSTATDVEVCVDDGDEQDCHTFSITVSTAAPGAGGFCFIDADDGNDTTGSGTLASPWRTLSKARASCGARSILYFRGATADYTTAGLTPTADECNPTRIAFLESSQPVIWLAYPGERPVLNLAGGGVPVPPCIQFTGENIWIDGLTIEDADNIALQFTRRSQFGSMVRRVTMRGGGPGVNEFNPAYLMYNRCDGCPSYWDAVLNSTFSDIEYGQGFAALKLYSTIELVASDNTVENVHDRTGERESIFAIKDQNSQFTVRNNRFSNFVPEVPCLGGNMHNSKGTVTYGEILFNNCLMSGGAAYYFNQDGVAGRIDNYRNTFLGNITAFNTGSGDGPFNFVQNVIVNDGGSGGGCPQRITCSSVTDFRAIVVNANNLQGADNGTIVNRAGELQRANLANHGPASATPKGHMLAPPSSAYRSGLRFARPPLLDRIETINEREVVAGADLRASAWLCEQ